MLLAVLSWCLLPCGALGHVQGACAGAGWSHGVDASAVSGQAVTGRWCAQQRR